MIKSIIYLDEVKMYSLSSQIFEGITEYMLKEIGSTNEKSEEQKGPVASGRIVADAMKLSERSIEKRFLHDHSLSLFEAQLNKLDLVSHVNATENSGVNINTGKSFIRVQARANFIDAAKVISMLESFNKIGEALAYVTKYPEIDKLRKAMQEEKNKNKLNDLKQTEKHFTNTAELAKQTGHYQDPIFLKNLALVTEFGFSDQLEVQQRVGNQLFSACLKRQCLRESEDMIVRKYSRKTEKDLVVLGITTQSKLSSEKNAIEAPPENMSMKEAITNMINHISLVEGSLSGKSAYEIVIDPIAVYVTL